MGMAEWIALHRLPGMPVAGRMVGVLEGEPLDHAALLARVERWRVAFADVPGKDWALYFDDALAFAAALFGAWAAGKRVFLPADNLPATLASLRTHVAGYAGDIDAAWQPLALAEAASGVCAGSGVELDEQACRLVVFTSGSTGEPAPMEKRLAQLAREVEALEQAFGAPLDGVRIHGTVSHQHIYGLLFRVLWPLAAGRAIQPRRFFHEDLVVALAQAPAVLVATPAHLKRLPVQLDWAAARGNLRAVFSSGGPLPADAAVRARALLGSAPIEIFGSSETGGIAWRRSEGAAPPPWQPLPGVRWCIDDGQLAVASAHLEHAGWWRTADRAEAVEGGFRVLGRADRIVKIEERRVSLDALERALQADPAVQDVRVLVLPGQRDQLAAVVVPTQPDMLQADDAERRLLTRRLGETLAASHDAVTRPRRWRLVPALPFNAHGKVPLAALAALFQADLPPVRWLSRGPASAVLDLSLTPGLRVFDGHFPDVAVLPGVAQVDWAIALARQVFMMPPRFLRMEAVKFQHLARPGYLLRLHLQWDDARQVLAFRFTSDHGVHASGKVLFADAD